MTATSVETSSILPEIHSVGYEDRILINQGGKLCQIRAALLFDLLEGSTGPQGIPLDPRVDMLIKEVEALEEQVKALEKEGWST